MKSILTISRFSLLFIIFTAFFTTTSLNAQYYINGPSEANKAQITHFNIQGSNISSILWKVHSGGTLASIASSKGVSVFWFGPTKGILGVTVTDQSSNTYKLSKTITITPPPPTAPPAPTIQSSNCGSTVIARATPPTNVTYYWQSTPLGTSTSNSSISTTKTYGSGTQYLRTKRNSDEIWSISSSSVNYTVKTAPAIPSVPTITNNCGNTVITRGTPPSGETWYWQNSPGTTNMSNSNINKTFTTAGIYFLRSRNNTSGCWSGVKGGGYSVYKIPPAPPAPTVTNNCGSTVLTRATPSSGHTYYWQSSSTGTSTSNSNSNKTFTSGTGTYFLRSRNNTTGCWSSATSVSYSINLVPAPPIPTVTNNCGSTILTRATPSNGYTYYWQSSSTGTSISNSNSIITFTSGSGTYFLRNQNNTTKCWSNATSVVYSITPPPLWYADTDGDSFGNPNATVNSCSQPNGYVSNSSDYNDDTPNITNIQPQYFYKDEDGDGFGDPNDSVYYSVQPPNYVTNNTDACPEEAGSYNGCDYTPATLSDENYVYTKIYQRAMEDDSEINNNTDIIELANYYDGLGRPMQSIAIKNSPDKKDVITYIGYDDYGRQDKDYLPYEETSGAVGTYRNNAEASTISYYQSNYVDAMNTNYLNPFSEKEFEASPLSRVYKQAAPGYDWRLGGGHDIKFSYDANTFDPNNTDNASNDNVRLYGVSLNYTNKTYTPTLTLDSGTTGYYNAGELYKTVIKDENYDSSISTKAHSTEEFKDKQGRIILKRTYGTSTENGVSQNNTIHDTYYVYDDYDNLTYVLPPKMNAGDGDSASNTIISQLNDLGYQYIYGYRNRLVEKKIPGKDWEYIIYDALDRPTLTQDANQRLTNSWVFTKYDIYERIAYTGTYIDNNYIGRINMQNHFDSQNNADTNMFELKVDSGTGYNNSYYTNANFPNTNIELLIINYYDNYSFDKATLNLPSEAGGQSIINYDNTDQQKTKSLSTASKVRVLGTTDWITTIIGYEAKGRPIYTTSKNPYLETTDIIISTLDFVGKINKTTTTHARTGFNTITTVDSFTYDHAGRLETQKQKIDSYLEELIVLNVYDKLGQLINKKVGGHVNTNDIKDSDGLQTVKYNYNIRGWLKQINNPTNLGNDLFGFKIGYNEGVTPLYNGNIALTQWKTANTDNNLKSYNYTYDALNRLTSAVDNTNHYNLSNLSYDKNGNILSLNRGGHLVEEPDPEIASHWGNMDVLTYNYQSNSNTLLKVTDATLNTSGNGEFKDGNTSGNDYGYDANGNMTKDLNKGIGTTTTNGITYNHLNLPELITVNDGGSNNGNIKNVYDATGIKLKKIVSTGVTTEYAGNYVYENGCLKFFNTSEGYFDVTSPPLGELEGDYVYQYIDHLGSIRLSYKDNNGSLEVLEENNYYPFGLKHKGYNNVVNGTEYNYKTFQGQEISKELGLNWLSFKYRNYDPSLARFHNIDPLAQEYAYQSPYNFSENRVIDGVELEGAERLSVHTPTWVYGTNTIRNEHPTGAQMNTSTAAVVARHPIASNGVGAVERGGTNISSISGRIARHAGANGNMTVGEGSERNALRHATWVATITSNYGDGVAQRIGNAHEGIPMGAQGNAHVDFDQPAPDNLGGADSVVDFLNNEIGRGIGAELGEGATEWQAAVKALDVQLNDGLWTATTDKDGNINISRTKITQKQYNTAMKTLRTLNRNGMNSADRKSLEEE